MYVVHYESLSAQVNNTRNTSALIIKCNQMSKLRRAIQHIVKTPVLLAHSRNCRDQLSRGHADPSWAPQVSDSRGKGTKCKGSLSTLVEN